MSRGTWTDDRLDDFARNVDRRFDDVDRRFNEVDRRFDKVDQRFDKVEEDIREIRAEVKKGFIRVDDRLDGIQRMIFHGAIAMTAGVLAGFGGIAAVIAAVV